MEDNEIKTPNSLNPDIAPAEEAAPEEAPKKGKFGKLLLLVGFVILIVILVRACGNSDKSRGVKDMVFNDISTDKTMGELLSTSPFCDLKWSSESDSRVYAHFSDTYGNNYVMRFDLNYDSTLATTGSIAMNGVAFDEWEQIGFFSYLGTGNYEDFNNYLIGLEIVKDYFGE